MKGGARATAERATCALQMLKLVRLSGESDPAKISYVNLPSCAPLR